jgi:outer membrane autotransporter protein
VGGIIDMGDGNDTLKIRPERIIPSNLILGPGNDVLHLVSFQNEVAGNIDLAVATDFEGLLIGPDSKNIANAWTITTVTPSTFTAGVTLQSGDLIYDGLVDLTADFVQQADSAMVFDLGRDIVDSQLALTGGLTIDPESELKIRVSGGIMEDSYTLISTTGGITGDFDTLTTPSLAIFDITAGVVGNDYILTVTRASSLAAFARTSSEVHVAEYLDDVIFLAGPSAMPETIAALEVLDDDQLSTALGQLHPEIYDAHTSNILAWGRMQQQVLQNRPMDCERYQYSKRTEIVSESPCGSRKFLPWAKMVGNIGRHSGGEPKGYDTLAGGLLIGIDHRWKDGIWFSGDIGYGYIDIDSDNGGDGDFDTIDLGAAAGMVRGPIRVRGSMTYSHGFHHMKRDLDFLDDQSKGDFDSDRITLAAAAGYQFKPGHFVVEPNVTMDYSHVEEESLKETGNDEVSLDVRSRSTDVFAITPGVRVSTNFLKYGYSGPLLEWADGVWSPVVSLQWRQAVGDVDRDLKAEMRAGPEPIGNFEANADDSDGGLEVGTHISFQPLNTSTTIELGYDGYFGDDVTRHELKTTVRIPF